MLNYTINCMANFNLALMTRKFSSQNSQNQFVYKVFQECSSLNRNACHVIITMQGNVESPSDGLLWGLRCTKYGHGITRSFKECFSFAQVHLIYFLFLRRKKHRIYVRLFSSHENNWQAILIRQLNIIISINSLFLNRKNIEQV